MEIQPVHLKGDQSWVFIGRTDAEAEAPIVWPPDEKSWLIWKDPDAGKDWRQEEKGTTEDEMAGWHPWLDGRESEWTLGVGDGQGGLACCDSWDHEESDMIEQMNWTELKIQKLPSACTLLFPPWRSTIFFYLELGGQVLHLLNCFLSFTTQFEFHCSGETFLLNPSALTDFFLHLNSSSTCLGLKCQILFLSFCMHPSSHTKWSVSWELVTYLFLSLALSSGMPRTY